MDPGREARTEAVHAVRVAATAGLELPRVSWAYRGVLFSVALVVSALPALYVAAVMAGFAIVHREAARAAMAFDLGLAARLAAYAGPMLFTVLCTLFLLKPFVAPRVPPRRAHVLTRGQEPTLFAFVGALSRLVGAPAPGSIEVTCDVNAGADLRRGVRKRGDGDLVLTIGLPIVAGLDLEELAGVLAHELGHFSQRAGLRLHLLVRGMNRWFQRVVYEQDVWDRVLAHLVSSPWPGVRGMIALTVALLAMGVVSLSRLLLYPLMLTARFLSGALLRHMELDADRVHAHVVGGARFEDTVVRLALLEEGVTQAAATLERSWAEGRLGDDLTALIVDHAEDLDEVERATVVERLLSRRSGWSDSHPAPAERIERVRAVGPHAALELEGPATVLFRDFGALARQVTLAQYRAQLGDEVSPEALVATGWIHAQRAQSEVFEKAVLRYVGVPLVPERPLSLGLAWIAPPGTFDEERARLVEARRALVAALPRARQAARLRAGNDFQRQVAELATSELEDRAGERLGAALKLLELDGDRGGVALERIGDLERMRARARALRVALVVLEPTLPKLDDVWKDRLQLERFGRDLAHPDRARWALERLMAMAPMAAVNLGAVRAPLTQHAYPYPHASRGMTIGRYVLEALPDATDPAMVLEASDQLVTRLIRFYTRVLGELAQISETIEDAIGLERLDLEATDGPAPEGESDDSQAA